MRRNLFFEVGPPGSSPHAPPGIFPHAPPPHTAPLLPRPVALGQARCDGKGVQAESGQVDGAHQEGRDLRTRNLPLTVACTIFNHC